MAVVPAMDFAGCETLDSVRAALEGCTRCALSHSRTRIVFGTGDEHASVMLLGEAPGRNEDERGEPFIGAAGRLLDELLVLAGLARSDLFITNVVKCRPPENRDPARVEIATCAPVLSAQLRFIEPLVVVTLGNFATKAVLSTDKPIGALRGRVHECGGRTVIPVYHPAAAIYDRAKRPVLEDDFRFVGRVVSGRMDEGTAL